MAIFICSALTGLSPAPLEFAIYNQTEPTPQRLLGDAQHLGRHPS